MGRLVLTQITIKKERSISSTTWYYLLQPSDALAPDSTNYGNPPPTIATTGYSGWSTTEPTYTAGDNRVLYTMVQTLFSDGDFKYSIPTISSSYEAAKAAYNEVIQAEETIQDFIDLGLKQGYFWDNNTYVPSSSTIPAYPVGSYIASGLLVNGNRTITRSNANTYGLNTWISTGGINLRYNAIDLMKLTTSNLKFYYPSTVSQGTEAISLGTHGNVNSLVFYKFNSSNKAMELTNEALIFYDGTGQIAQASFGGTKATISGTINVYDGQIGNSDNSYWYIGNYRDYMQNESAAIKSYGTGFIQLGNSLTWRLATNRIHTAWNDDTTTGTSGNEAFRLHFPSRNDNMYWDSGLHLPLTNTDKFLYIRNAPNTYTLENLGDDLEDSGYEYWTYKFYIDGSGNLKTTGSIDAHNISIDGQPMAGGSLVAGSLASYGGTSKIPVYFPSDGNNKGKPVAIEVLDNTSATAVASNDDRLITARTLYYAGYLPLTGGNVTGAVTFGDSVSIDNLTAGNLVVNGSASFTNNLQANTINGVVVGTNPKFTDTVTTVTVSGSGNAITTISATNGAITATKGATFLTSYTETDPTVPSWAKANTKPSYAFSEIDSKPTTLSGYGITNAYTKAEVDGLVASVLHYKGTKASYSNLPSSGNVIGDVWHITNTGAEYAWDGSAWQELGTTVDLSAYALSADLPTKVSDLTNDSGFITANHTSTYTLPTASSSILGGIKVGDGVSISDGILSHMDTSSQASSSNSGRTYIQSITLDTYGHITGLSTATETVTNTHYTANLITGTSASAKSNAATTSENVYLNLIENNEVRNSHQITGSGTVSVASDANGKITITGSAHPTTLPNPKSLSIIVHNATSTTASSTTTTYNGGEDSNTSVTVAGVNAVTNISSNINGQLILTRADGSRSEPITVKITATTSDTAASADKLNLSEDAGSTSLPVYFPSNTGIPTAVTSIAYSLLPTGTTASTVAVGNHTHGNITNGGDITATAPAVANGDQIVINDHSASKITNGPTFDGSTTTAFLTKAGTWATPAGTYSLPLADNGTRGGVQIGYSESGTNYAVKLSSEKMYVSVPWTDTKVTLEAVTSGTTYYPIVGTSTTTATRQYDSTGFVYVGTNGTANSTNGNALLTLGNSTAATAANWKKGTIRLYGTTTHYINIVSGAPTENRTITLPDKTGTVAIIDDIPDKTDSSTTGITVTTNQTTSVTGVQSNTTSVIGVDGSTSVYGVKSGTNSTTTASKASGSNGTAPTLGTAITIRGVKTGTNSTTVASKVNNGGNGSASTWSFTDKTNITQNLSITYNSSDTSLDIEFSTTTVSSKSGGSNGTAPTWSFTDVTVPIRADNDTSIPNVTDVGSASTWSFTNVTVPIRADSATTVPIAASSATTVPIKATSATSIPTSYTVTDPGHTHTI